ncbi:MAG TPA: hypothetical protein VD772_11720, partial [Anseongella sp.]|nr:hypothetical protein [Anseongella sp.]
ASAQSIPAKIWDKGLGGSASDDVTSVTATADGGLLLGGYSASGLSGDKSEASRGGSDFWVVKLDMNGTKQWDKTFGGSGSDNLYSVIQTTDGGYLLAGLSTSGIDGDKTEAGRGSTDYWIVKLDASGTRLWDKTYGGSADDRLYSVLQTTDGGFLMGGYTTSGISGDKTSALIGGYDLWVIKTDGNGNKLWDKTYGGSGSEIFSTLRPTADGGYLIGGSSDSGISGDKSEASRGAEDYWILKINAAGTKQWDKTFGSTTNDNISSLSLTADGGYILGGYSDGNGGDKSEASRGNYDFWVVKVSSNGSKQWDKTFGGSDSDSADEIIQTADGNYLMAGGSTSPVSGDKTLANKGSMDTWLVKFGPTGTKLWDRTYGGTNYDYGGLLAESADGSYLLAGSSFSGRNGDKSTASRGNFDYWVIKMTSGSPPAVSGVFPAVSPANCQVTVNGSNFGGATAVQFNGTATTSFTVSADGTSITATIPGTATTGIVSVTTPEGTGSSSSPLTVVRPTITASGATTFCAGGSVQLTATSNYTQSGSAISFDGNGNYLNVPNFNFNSNGGPVTVEFWTKASAATSGSRSIFAITTADGQRFQAHVPGTGNILHFDYGNFSG